MTVGYVEADAAALSRLSLVAPISENILSKSADWLETWIPAAQTMLEPGIEDRMRKIEQYALSNPALFREGRTGPRGDFIVQAVYPAIGQDEAIVIVHEQGTTEYYAADWSEAQDGDIEFHNVRDVSWKYESYIARVQENLSEAIQMVHYAVESTLAAESNYLATRVLGKPVVLPALRLDGLRPAQEEELQKFYARGGFIENRIWQQTILSDTKFEGSVTAKDAVVLLADSMNRQRKMNKRAVRQQVRLIRPTLGSSMQVGKRTEQDDIVSLIFSKKVFDSQAAKSWAKLHDFRYGTIAETADDLRLEQSDLPCKKGSTRLLPVARGISATVCGRG